MELSWTTLILEIINFLVLIWILKHFLYKPVLDIIERRRAAIEKTLQDASTTQTQAESLRQQYENRLAVWEQDRQQEREKLTQEIELERQRRLSGLNTLLEEEREKARVIAKREEYAVQQQAEVKAMQLATGFAARLLTGLAIPALEQSLLDMLVEQIKGLPRDRLEKLKGGSNKGIAAEAVTVASAFVLNPAQRNSIEQCLHDVVQVKGAITYQQTPELLAGLHITIGAWVLHANLRDELRAFSDLVHAD